MRYFLASLLVFVPVAFLAEFLHWPAAVLFFASALGIVPLAWLLGDATEALASRTSPRMGGLLNATMGNAAELIIILMAVRAGEMTLVSASIIGSILGNVLLVMGAAAFFGGLKHGVQQFDREQAGLDAAMLLLAAIAIAVPSLFNLAIEPDVARVEELSLATALVMLVIYGLATGYSLWRKAPENGSSPGAPHWSVGVSVAVLSASVLVIGVLSEFLVATVEPVTQQLHFSTFFVGIILIPIIGNVAEHFVAVEVALKNQMDLSLSVALGSSLQIALFVAPLVVLISPLLGHTFVLEFNRFELIALGSASVIGAVVSMDGRTNWLEGVMLLGVYLILAIAFFFLPPAL